MKKCIFFLFALFLFNSLNGNITVEPLIANLNLKEGGNTKIFRVVNSGSSRVAAQVKILERKPDIWGDEDIENAKEAEDDFIIFPQQMIINPKSEQAVQVQWIGEPDLKVEKSFRTIFEQVSVGFGKFDNENLTTSQGIIEMLFSYVGILNTVPSKKSKPNIFLDKIEAAKSESGEKFIRISLKNDGSRSGLIDKPKLIIFVRKEVAENEMDEEKTKNRKTRRGRKKASLSRNRDEKIVLESIEKYVAGSILAGYIRNYQIPWPKEIKSGSIVKGEFECDYVNMDNF